MRTFQIRVELHGARRSDQYTALHQKMYQYGALMIIQGKDDVYYGLPPAEYRISSSPKVSWDICSDVATIASSVTDPGDASPSVVVSEVVETSFKLSPVPLWKV